MVRIWRYAVLALLSITINLSLSWSFCVGTDGVHCHRRLHHLQQQHHHCPHAGHRAYSIKGANQNDGERQDLSHQHPSPRHEGAIVWRKDLMMQGLKGLCGISMSLQWMRSKPVIAASNVQQGNIEGSGKTFREKNRPALLEALVYLPKGVNYWGELLEGQTDEEIVGEGDAKDGGEGGNEALFLTVSAGKMVVLGARVPMTATISKGIMFPFLAQFYEDNIVGGRKAWDAVKNEDLVVRARVCATGDYPPCSKPLLRSASVSKFLLEVKNPNDPSGGDVVARNVRIGATLMLRAPSAPTTLDEFNKMQKKGATGHQMKLEGDKKSRNMKLNR